MGEDKMEEIWKDIPGYEGLYKVNTIGEIWTERYEKKLKYSISSDGYKQYNLRKDKKAHIMAAHKAVALAFIPNTNNLPLINHKDENKLNCYYENLEWCTPKYNITYNGLNERVEKVLREKYGTEFYIYDTKGNYIGKFKGTRKFAREHDMSSGSFSSALRKNNDGIKRYSCKGYIPSLLPLKDNLC